MIVVRERPEHVDAIRAVTAAAFAPPEAPDAAGGPSPATEPDAGHAVMEALLVDDLRGAFRYAAPFARTY